MKIQRIVLAFALVILSAFVTPASPAAETGGIIEEVISSGQGGLLVRDNCPPGSVLVGVEAFLSEAGDESAITAMQGICRELEADGKSLGETRSKTELRGEEGKSKSITSLCSRGKVVVGASVYNNSESKLVMGIEITCGDLPFGKDRVQSSSIGITNPVPEALRCDQEKVGIGLVLRFGAAIDAFGIQCGEIKNVEQEPLTDIQLSSTSKEYPFEESLEILNSKGGSSDGEVSITDIRDKVEGTSCVLQGNLITALSSGTCVIEVTKAGDSFYAPVSREVEFNFLKAVPSITFSPVNDLQTESDYESGIEILVSGAFDSAAVSFEASDVSASGCSVSTTDQGLLLTAQSAGDCLIKATFAEGSFFQASEAEATFSLSEIAPLEEVAYGEELFPAYDPFSEPEEVVGLQVAAFALLSVVAVGATLRGATSDGSNSPGRRKEDEEKEGESEGESDRESGDVASADVTKVAFQKRSLGWGDNSRLWQIAMTTGLERRFIKWVEGTSKFSPLMSRVLLDGSHMRAMFSGFSLVPALIATVASIILMQDSEFNPYPTSVFLLSLILFMGTLDAFAGLCSAIVVIVGATFTGNLGTLDELMSLLGFAAIVVTPGLIASGIRPLRRIVQSKADVWERLTDYLLAPLLGGWAVGKLVGSLNGLAGLQLPITENADQIGVLTSIFILIRLVLEDLATHLFPDRLAQQEARPGDALPSQPWLATLVKTGIFALVSYQFLGLNIQLIFGTAIFLIPQIFAVLSKSLYFKKYGLVRFVIPKGAPKIIIMVFVGGLFADLVQRLVNDDALFMTWSFVLLAIPGFILGMLKLVATSSSGDWKTTPFGAFVYRFGGVIVAGMIIALYQGVDFYALVFNQ